MGEHRVPLLGSGWRRNEDPARSRDPRVRAVVGALANVPAPEMDAAFRAELRAQLVAITPRIVAEGAPPRRATELAPAAPRTRPTPQGRGKAVEAVPARHSDSVVDRLRRLHLGRPLAVATAVIVAFAVLLGGAAVMSRKALPGDALYGLKRAGERLELATAGSDTEKAKDYLDFARTRANEVKDLLGRAGSSALRGTSAGGVNAGTAKLISSTLGSADDDVKAASRLLTTSAVRHNSTTPLSTMTNWAPAQVQRLQRIVAAVPDPTLRAQAQSSLRLVQAAAARADALRSKVGCDCLGGVARDELGPKPCTTCSTTKGGTNPTGPARTGGATGHRPKTDRTTSRQVPGAAGPTGSGSATSAPGAGPGAGGGPQPGSSSSGAPSKTPPIINIPSLLPSGTPSVPVSASSCGVTVSLPLIGGVGVGLCSGVDVKVGG